MLPLIADTMARCPSQVKDTEISQSSSPSKAPSQASFPGHQENELPLWPHPGLPSSLMPARGPCHVTGTDPEIYSPHHSTGESNREGPDLNPQNLMGSFHIFNLCLAPSSW